MKDYFTRDDGSDELACRCKDVDCTLTVRPSTRAKCNKMREILGRPLYMFGARCPKHIEYSGSGSSHDDRLDMGGTEACAVDPVVRGDKELRDVLKAGIEAGFTRWGIGKNQLHLDDDETKSQTMWFY